VSPGRSGGLSEQRKPSRTPLLDRLGKAARGSVWAPGPVFGFGYKAREGDSLKDGARRPPAPQAQK
jgi:hypothetical protein